MLIGVVLGVGGGKGSAKAKQLWDTVLGSFWVLVGEGLCKSKTALGHRWVLVGERALQKQSSSRIRS